MCCAWLKSGAKKAASACFHKSGHLTTVFTFFFFFSAKRSGTFRGSRLHFVATRGELFFAEPPLCRKEKCTLRACDTTIPRTGLRRSAGVCASVYVTRLARFLHFLPRRCRTGRVFDYSSSTVSPSTGSSRWLRASGVTYTRALLRNHASRPPTGEVLRRRRRRRRVRRPPPPALFASSSRLARPLLTSGMCRTGGQDVSPCFASFLGSREIVFSVPRDDARFLPALISDFSSRCRPRFS